MLWYPNINIPVLFCFGFILWYIFKNKLKKYNNTNFKIYWIRTQWLFGGSFICWIGDRFFCKYTQSFQLHAMWHILSAFAAYYSILIGIFIEYNRDNYYITQNHILPIVNKIINK